MDNQDEPLYMYCYFRFSAANFFQLENNLKGGMPHFLTYFKIKRAFLGPIGGFNRGDATFLDMFKVIVDVLRPEKRGDAMGDAGHSGTVESRTPQ